MTTASTQASQVQPVPNDGLSDAPTADHSPPETAISPTSALLKLIAPVRGRLIWAVTLGALSAALRVAALVLSGLLIRNVLDGITPVQAVWWIVSIVAAMALSGATSTWASAASHHSAFDHEGIIRKDLTRHLGRLPLGVVQSWGSGGLKKVIQGDVRGMHAAIADAPPMIGAAIGGAATALIALGILEWRLLLLTIVVLPIVMVVMKFAMKDYATERAAYDQALERIDSAAVEYVQGMQDVRTFDGGSDSFGKFVDRVKDFSARTKAWNDRSRISALSTRLLIAPLPVTVIVAIGGALMVGQGWVDPVTVVIALLLAPVPMDSVMPVMMMSEYINRATSSAVRITEVLTTPALPITATPVAPADGSVRLEGVTFSYDAEREPALNDVTVDIPAGSVCAFVGPSGSGKSTVARLVPRFYDVTEGRVLVGGQDVRDMDPDVLLASVALVFQDPFLIRASITENLTLGRADATTDEIIAACQAARVHDEILALPHGYDTVVGERGTSLSGGQRQRLTVARALLSPAKIVILDEATAFADPENEAAIQDAIAELTRDRTVIIVAHRLSTIIGADQIVVLDGGKVAERGRHVDLVAAHGRYRTLWDRHIQAQSWGLRRAGAADSEGVRA